MTRHGPNSSWKPSVTLNAPPYTPTSSPSTNTRLSRRISCRRPSLIACRYVRSAIDGSHLLVVRRVEVLGGRIDALEQRRRVGHRRLLRALQRAVQQLLHVARDLVLLVVRHLDVLAQPAAIALERIALRPALEELLRDVERVVVHRVSFHAQRLTLDERRPAAVARLLDRVLRLAV